MRNSNQTRNSLLLALLATGALAAGTLFAAPPAGEGMHRIHKMGGAFLAKADANKDGNISQAEHDALRAAHLAELDRNNDGFVTYDEHKVAMEARAREMFTKHHDQNGDGRVSVDEMAERGEGMFQRLDADKDGMVTAEEMKAGHDSIRKRIRRGAERPATTPAR